MFEPEQQPTHTHTHTHTHTLSLSLSLTYESQGIRLILAIVLAHEAAYRRFGRSSVDHDEEQVGD
jgi:hypothetical protein